MRFTWARTRRSAGQCVAAAGCSRRVAGQFGKRFAAAGGGARRYTASVVKRTAFVGLVGASGPSRIAYAALDAVGEAALAGAAMALMALQPPRRRCRRCRTARSWKCTCYDLLRVRRSSSG